MKNIKEQYYMQNEQNNPKDMIILAMLILMWGTLAILIIGVIIQIYKEVL